MTGSQYPDPQALIRQLTQATSELSDQEAAQRYQQILRQLPPDQAAELNALALSQIGQGERRSLAGQFRQAHHNPNTPFDGYDFDDDDEAASPMGLGRMSARAQQQDPSLLDGVLGGKSPMGGAIGKAALAALAALLVRQMMSGQQSRARGQGMPQGGMPGGMGGGADPIGSILGSLLGRGGGMGGPMGGGMGGPMGGGTGRQQPGGIDIGSILSGVLGGGSVARQAPQGGGLEDLLGSILGGGGGSQRNRW